MRDPERITEILEHLERLWRRCPDMRLGQLIIYCTPSRFGNDPFNVEDDEMLNEIKFRFEEMDICD